MTPPADPRATLRALVAAGEKATPGEWEARERTAGGRSVGCEIVGNVRFADDGSAMYSSPIARISYDFVHSRASRDFVTSAANARPALAALAGMCVLPVEVVRGLVEFARCWEDAASLGEDAELAAALAAAEAEVARVEGQRS